MILFTRAGIDRWIQLSEFLQKLLRWGSFRVDLTSFMYVLQRLLYSSITATRKHYQTISFKKATHIAVTAFNQRYYQLP